MMATEENFRLRPKRPYKIQIAREDMETPNEIMEDGIVYPYGEDWENATAGPYDNNKYDVGITKRNIDGIVKVLMQSGWMDITGPDFWEPITGGISYNDIGSYWSITTPADYLYYPTLRAKGTWYDAINPTEWKIRAEGAENWKPHPMNWSSWELYDGPSAGIMGFNIQNLDQWITSEFTLDISWCHTPGLPPEFVIYSRTETTLRLHQILSN